MRLRHAVYSDIGTLTRQLTCRNFRTITALVIVTFSLATSPALAGDLDKVFLFDIQAQSLDKALLQFGAQAHVQLSFAWNLSTARLRRYKLKGRYTGKDALAEILKGSRLSYVALGHTLEIVPQGTRDPSHGTPAREPSNAQHLRDSTASNRPMHPGLDPPVTDLQSQKAKPLGALGEIIVTAQKYSQRALDVPISLQVVTAQELDRHSISTLSDLQYDVPGMYVSGTGVYHTVYIRGIANAQGTGALVGEYIDDADATAEGVSGVEGFGAGDYGIYDLDRVEVLRGPQGTLYGDGSLGGVIRYITNRPRLDRFQMSADVAALFTQYGAPSQHIETMLNAPLVPGTLGLRFAGQFEHDGGWIDEPVANLKNTNDSNITDVRAEARWAPTTQLTVDATQILHRANYGLGLGEDSSGNITPLFGLTAVPNGTDNSNLSNITLNADIASERLISSTTYFNDEQVLHNPFLTVEGLKQPTWITGTFGPVATKDFSQELRLVHPGGDLWQWTVGAFYKNFRDAGLDQTYVGRPGPLSAASFSAFSQQDQSNSLAGFADSNVTLAKRLIAGAGVRYYRDRESNQETGSSLQTATFTSTDPRVYVQYRVTSNVNTYASASKGFRSGGFNVPPESPYGPESLWTYDLGTKLSLPASGVRADLDLFYSDYSNFVVAGLFPPNFESVNGGKARVKGADVDAMWRVLSDWRLSVAAEVENSEFVSVEGLDTGFAVGDRLPYTPRYSFTASVERDTYWNGKPGYLELYYSQISRLQYRVAGRPLDESDVIRFLNFHAGVDWNNGLNLAVFAHNLLNDRGLLNPLAHLENYSARPRPRTFGVEFKVNFN